MTLREINDICTAKMNGIVNETEIPWAFWENVGRLSLDLVNQEWREKQIAKRPTKAIYGFYECPTCHKPTVDDDFDYFNYCYNCGQKIDWSGV